MAKKLTKTKKTKVQAINKKIALKHALPEKDIQLHQDAVVTVEVNGRQISINADDPDLEEKLDGQITKFKDKKTTKKDGDKTK